MVVSTWSLGLFSTETKPKKTSHGINTKEEEEEETKSHSHLLRGIADIRPPNTVVDEFGEVFLPGTGGRGTHMTTHVIRNRVLRGQNKKIRKQKQRRQVGGGK